MLLLFSISKTELLSIQDDCHNILTSVKDMAAVNNRIQ